MAKWYHAGAKVHGPVALSLAIFTFFILSLELFFCCILVLCAFGVCCVCVRMVIKKSKAFFQQHRIPGVPMQYEEACERVYGEPYADWKKKNQKKASSSASN